MQLRPSIGKVSVLGSLAVSGLLVASLAPAANAANPAHPVAIPAHTNPAQVLHTLTVGPAGKSTSQNWSGYVATPAGGTYTTVSSTWKEPAVACTSTNAIAVFWVGIDGDPSSTVEQDGSLAQCSGGQASYYTWWEMYPTNSVQIVGTTVQAGDVITSSVVRNGSSYTLVVKDATNPANSFSRQESCASCQNSSAEWIAERPSGSGGLFPLPNYGTMMFGKDKATSNAHSGSISAFPHDSIVMVNSGGQTLASVGRLKKQGSRFSDTWHQIS